MVKRRLMISLAVLAAASVGYGASAEGFGNDGASWRPHHHGHHGHHGHWGRGHGRDTTDGGSYGVPVVIPGVGTYAGTVSALHVRGNGTYYYAEGLGGCAEAPAIRLAPVAKIVDATKGPACSWENGVCVIRP